MTNSGPGSRPGLGNDEFILHIAHRQDWAGRSGAEYRTSSLETEGFIHCSSPSQTVATAKEHFRGKKDLVLLKILPAKLKAELKYEVSRGGESFPHIYGGLNADAVTDVIDFPEYEGGFYLPARAGLSLFSKIIRGEIPSYKVYENEWVYALLTRDAIQLGHSLVVPKLDIDHFSDVPEPFYSAVFSAGKKLSHAIQTATGCGRVGVMIVGWEVRHFHLHLIPTFGPEDFDFRKAKVRTPEENQAVLEKIIRAL